MGHIGHQNGAVRESHHIGARRRPAAYRDPDRSDHLDGDRSTGIVIVVINNLVGVDFLAPVDCPECAAPDAPQRTKACVLAVEKGRVDTAGDFIAEADLAIVSAIDREQRSPARYAGSVKAADDAGFGGEGRSGLIASFS